MCCKQLMFNQTTDMKESTLMGSTTPKCQSYSGTSSPTKDLLNLVPDEALKLILCEPETSASNRAWGQRSGAKVEGLTFNIRCTESEISSLNCLMLLLVGKLEANSQFPLFISLFTPLNRRLQALMVATRSYQMALPRMRMLMMKTMMKKSHMKKRSITLATFLHSPMRSCAARWSWYELVMYSMFLHRPWCWHTH